MQYTDYSKFCYDLDMKLGEFIRWLDSLECPENCPDDGSGNCDAFFQMTKGEQENSFINLREETKERLKEYFKIQCVDILKLKDNENHEETSHKGIKGMFKGIICLLFGHDWVSYNEHAWICSRCMEVAPKN